jgi:hypothetical protein
MQRFTQMQASDIDIYRTELRKTKNEIVRLAHHRKPKHSAQHLPDVRVLLLVPESGPVIPVCCCAHAFLTSRLSFKTGSRCLLRGSLSLHPEIINMSATTESKPSWVPECARVQSVSK